MNTEDDDTRGSMMAACYALLGVWLVFGGFIAWLGMSLVQGDIIAFLESFALYTVVSGAVLALLYASIDENR